MTVRRNVDECVNCYTKLYHDIGGLWVDGTRQDVCVWSRFEVHIPVHDMGSDSYNPKHSRAFSTRCLDLEYARTRHNSPEVDEWLTEHRNKLRASTFPWVKED